jgi:hypothetical protein
VHLTRLLVGALAVGNGIGGTGTANQTLTAKLQPLAKLSVPATLSLSAGGSQFAPFTGTLVVSYRARTISTNSTGTIAAQVTSDFATAASGNPSAAAGALTYTCSSAGLGTPCSGTITASTTVSTTVVALPASACTGGGGSCSSSDPATVNVNFILADSPGYSTGAYSAQVKFSISGV